MYTLKDNIKFDNDEITFQSMELESSTKNVPITKTPNTWSFDLSWFDHLTHLSDQIKTKTVNN